MSKFVHLHNHTEYSLLDGLSRIKKLFAHVKENDMDAIAITDHGAMYGAVEFFKEGKKQEIKPIIGLEGYVTRDMNTKVKDNFHITLLAKDLVGYKNLMELSSIAHLEGYYYKPRFSKEILKDHSQGLICFSGCPAAEIPQYLIDENYVEAKKLTQWYVDIFKEDFYLEIQRHHYDKILPTITDTELRATLSKIDTENKKVENGVIKLSRDLGIPLVATNDCHYIKKEDAPAQDALLCIATGKNVTDIKRMRYIDNPDFFVKSPDEMAEVFQDLPDAINNTVEIAEKCNLELELGKSFYPQIDLPQGKTAEETLKDLAHQRITNRYEKVTDEVLKRLNYELEIICNKGYASYFLILADLTSWCDQNGIITNTRGSAAGSVASYVMGITTVDPLRYALPFERFLNPLRPSSPDIDLDISDDRREDLIAYIVSKYGKEKVAQICTFGRMLAKAAVRDVARVLGYPYATGDKIAKLIPEGSQGFPMSIDRALEETSDLKSLYDSDSDTKKIIDLAKSIEGNARHLSVHAAGVVVSPTKITDFTPIQMEPKGGKVITQYEMHSIADEYGGVGLVKIDVLGIRNLSILGKARELAEKVNNIKIDFIKIPVDDKKTFEMLARGETMGTFQLSGSGMTKWLKELKPTRVEDLMIMVALYRPGPMANIPEYIARKNRKHKVTYMHPKMADFLDKSYGILVYQEDIMFTGMALAGYNWETIDKLRKAIGKKLPKEMAEQHIVFVDGCISNSQMTKEEAEKMWDLFVPFQGYGFNKAHAASYGMVAYYTSYMKANYPVEYMNALLSAESSDSEKVSQAVHECRRMGIKVLVPDVNESDLDFSISSDEESIEGKAIRFGLSAIKNVGKIAIEIILEARKTGPFLTFMDFVNRVDGRKVNKRVLESLIKVGAMDKFGKRTALLSAIDIVKAKLSKSKDNNGQSGLFSEEDESKISAFVSDSNIIDNSIDDFSDEERENFERELLGFSISAKPITELLDPIQDQITHTVSELDPNADDQKGKLVKIGVAIKEVRVILTKRNNSEMAFVRAEDTTGMVDMVISPKLYQDVKNLLLDGKVAIVTGKVDLRDDEISFLAESMVEVKHDDSHHITIPVGTPKENLLELKKLFDDNLGNDKVTLDFEPDPVKFELSKKILAKQKVVWSEELEREIQKVLQ
ncbi:MAG: DNA polymerase III subunit alpha [Patescibacteria group bacterium]